MNIDGPQGTVEEMGHVHFLPTSKAAVGEDGREEGQRTGGLKGIGAGAFTAE